MESKSSGEDNLLYEREHSQDFRTTDSTNLNENKKDSELWKIAGQINAVDIFKVGTILRFPTAKLDHLKDIYPCQPQTRLYILLTKWCEIVETKYGHHRRLLAKLLSEAEYRNISDSMNEDISDVTIPIQLTNVLCDVCFDTVNPNEARPDQEELWHDGASTETHSRKEYMINMLQELKLKEFYPSKISLPMINTIIEHSTDDEVTKESIPWSILRKFMNLNYKGRDADLNTLYDCHEDMNVDERSAKTNIHLHPLDVFLLTFLCCDPILQQELVSKMFFCRVAVPFIYRTLEDKLIMSKWAFRKIIINRKTGEEWVENDALSELVKIVSFIRVGPQTHATVSKSNMINELISFPTISTFFNKKNCVLFETEKLITNGMVEASWFVPSNRSFDNSRKTFKDVVMFLNLRGNSLKHDEEVKLVSSISDVIIVHIDANILTKSNIVRHLEKIHSFGKLIIYGIDCRKGDTGNKANFDCFSKNLKLNDVNTKRIKVEGGITLTLVTNFKRYILDFLSKHKSKQLSEVISNIKIGDDKFSVDGYRIAKDIVDIMDKQSENSECPLFPLQDTTWKKLCNCTKLLFRSKSDEEQEYYRKLQKGFQQEQFYLIKKSKTLQQFTRNRLSQGNNTENNNDNLFFIA